jgi:hypothetical protein
MASNDAAFNYATGQGDLFAAHRPQTVASAQPDLDTIRQKLRAMLEDVRGSVDGSPWDERETRKSLILFPQMSSALPNDEATELRSAFEHECARLGLPRRASPSSQ